ncbi:MAG: M28 family peptidase [Lunatimonas sp.]|uniref:M28 family peptidase n=1 Tax=Lunatimonas sp. TaxID=2060141 RepID=UPI00263BB2BA|nr:M28 family peptidase [Lunatimonas sp.]MCC5935896.1 M28 family peptidase [Lunatimonas sp.]
MYRIKHIFSLGVISVLTLLGNENVLAQKAAIDQQIEREEAISHFRFLASDELMGRDPARPEIDIAAKYIAEQFQRYGAKPLDQAGDFFQPVPFRYSAPPKKGELRFGNQTLTHGEDLLVLDGPDIQGSFDLVVAGYGMESDYAGKDVAGKMVVVRVGQPNRLSPSDLFASGREKLALAKEKGAAGIIEMYNVPTTPWSLLVNYLNKPQLTLDYDPDGSDAIPYIWVKDLSGELIQQISDRPDRVEAQVSGKQNRKITGKNVIAYIEGTDADLKNEYIMLSAHYDHLGVGKPNAAGDSIYNGARDNAVGTVAVINAAKFFAQHPPKRSILLCAWTAEEKGLLGSGYFANNPLLPLHQIVYNLNIDNAGYNDTSIVTVVGLGRTSVDPLIEAAVSEFGLRAIPDPSPEQGLYDRSDNVNFARQGIPAPTFSLGFTAFDDKIAQHYHQVSDQVDNFDLDYAMLYWKSYLLSAQKIANEPSQPKWKAGDKYEEAAKALYKLD